jgi:hypothetical protein
MRVGTAAAAVLMCACVPEGPSTADAGVATKPTALIPAAVRPKTAATAANDAAAASGSAHAVSTARAVARPITTAFEDSFERDDLGPNWRTLSPSWRIVRGRLCGRRAHNKGAWLALPLPTNVRIEFDAFAESTEGDLKVELFGDGESGATSTSYTNATSYLAILGGWKNSKHVLARLNEHGDDRQEIEVDLASDDERMRPVAAGQPYHFKLERSDGKTVEWSVNGATYLTFADRDPLVGLGHEHFGFNDWEAPVCFDNLKITPL